MKRSRPLLASAAAGLEAGALAAVAMAAAAIVGSVIAGRPWYAPFELIGTAVGGSVARVQPGLQAAGALLGLLTHILVGAAWGLIFGIGVALATESLVPSDGAAWGVVFGIVVWIVDVNVLLAHLDPAAMYGVPVWLGALTHAVYGAALGYLFPGLRERGVWRSTLGGSVGSHT